MSDEEIIAKICKWIGLWFLMAVFTYGHAYKQEAAIYDKECQIVRSVKNDAPCFGDPGVMAWGESLFWPYHWSATIWGKL